MKRDGDLVAPFRAGGDEPLAEVDVLDSEAQGEAHAQASIQEEGHDSAVVPVDSSGRVELVALDIPDGPSGREDEGELLDGIGLVGALPASLLGEPVGPDLREESGVERIVGVLVSTQAVIGHQVAPTDAQAPGGDPASNQRLDVRNVVVNRLRPVGQCLASRRVAADAVAPEELLPIAQDGPRLCRWWWGSGPPNEPFVQSPGRSSLLDVSWVQLTVGS